MRLKKLEIQGFKSFAQKTIFVFDDPLSAIVGPNGSGKSNVTDAIRWALGEQSLKLLRGKKAEDVIFHGSSKLPRMGLAEVNVCFDNKDGQIPIDYSEIVISRRLFRNGESEYLINKKKVRLADILLLLAKANFGQKSYAVIGQGMIDKILLQSAEERKEFFDEASGVKQYQIKRDQAVNKLIRTAENLEQAEVLIKEIEPRLKSLTRQVKKLEKREALSKELKEKQTDYFGFLWQNISTSLKRTTAQSIELDSEKQTTQKELEDVQAEIDRLAAEEGREDIFKNLQNEYNLINNEKNKLTKEQVILKAKLEVEQEKHGEVKLVWLTNQREELKAKTVTLETQASSLQRKLQKQGGLLSIKIRDQEKFQAEHRDLEYQLLKSREKLQDESAGLALPELRGKLKDIFNQQKNFLENIKKAENPEEWEALKKEAGKITRLFSDLVKEVSIEKKDEYVNLKAKIDQLQQKLEDYIAKKDNLINEVAELRIDLQTKERELSSLQEEFSQNNTNREEISQQIKEIQQALEKRLDKESRLKEYQQKFEELEKLIQDNDARLKNIQTKIDNFNQEEQKKKEINLEKQNRDRELQEQINQISNQLNTVNIEKAKFETKKEDLEAEIKEEVDPEEADKIEEFQPTGKVDTDILKSEIIKLKKQLEQIGGIDPEVQQEYENTSERFNFLSTQANDLNGSIESLNEIIEKLDKTIRKQFNKSFRKINDNFGKYFKVLFGGGIARLRLITEQEVEEEKEEEKQEEMARSGIELENGQVAEEIEEAEKTKYTKLFKSKKKNVSGIEIIAQPANKKIKTIAGLSGGEKSMTSLALLCSIIASNPPPFIILDEVEAALDEANSEKFIAIIKEFSKQTQFILITHNRVAINNANVLYGVTMGEDGISKILSVKLEDIEKQRLLENSKKLDTK